MIVDLILNPNRDISNDDPKDNINLVSFRAEEIERVAEHTILKGASDTDTLEETRFNRLNKGKLSLTYSGYVPNDTRFQHFTEPHKKIIMQAVIQPKDVYECYPMLTPEEISHYETKITDMNDVFKKNHPECGGLEEVMKSSYAASVLEDTPIRKIMTPEMISKFEAHAEKIQ